MAAELRLGEKSTRQAQDLVCLTQLAAGSAPSKGLLREAIIEEAALSLPAPTEPEDVLADYRHLGLTLGKHPLEFLRKRLHAMKFMPAEVLNHYGNAQLARGYGIVTVRQRP